MALENIIRESPLFFVPRAVHFKQKTDSTGSLTEKIKAIPSNRLVLTRNSHLATLVANHKRANDSDVRAYTHISFNLPDGTEIAGLYKSVRDTCPLIIGTFGFLSDARAHASRNFMNIVKHPYLRDNNILILDHPTSAPFYCANKQTSWGGIDEGYILTEVSRQMKEKYHAHQVHLIGISMGGLGVIHAAYRGEGIINSALAISAVTDPLDVPGSALRSLQSDGPFGKRFWDFTVLSHYLGLQTLWKEFRKIVGQSPKTSVSNIADIADLFLGTKRYTHELMENLLAPYIKEGIHHRKIPQTLEEYLVASDAVSIAPAITTPLYLLHAHDDSVVPPAHYYRFMLAARGNKKVQGMIMPDGGHWGFTSAYGTRWMAEVITIHNHYRR